MACAILSPMAKGRSWVLALTSVVTLSSGIAFARQPAADAAFANAGAATVPPTTPVEKKAARLSADALGPVFSAGHYDISVKKLREAIRICKPEVCSTSFQARLHRDLGFVYATGLELVDDGKDEFSVALDLDPTVVLPFVQQTGKATKAFAEAKKEAASGATKKPSAKAEGAAAPATATATEPKKGKPVADDGAATVAPATPVEKKAAKLSAQALGADYSAGHLKVSEKKLREAIRICGPGVCSTAFQARLHRDLGFVYVTGLDQVDDGKDEFTVALSLDSTVVLPFLQQTGGATKAFADVKKQLASAAGKPSAPVVATVAGKGSKSAPSADSSGAIVLESEPDTSAKAGTKPKAAGSASSGSAGAGAGASGDDTVAGRIVNWVSLALQQDLVIHSTTHYACSTGSRYECFAMGQRTILGANDFAPGGNQVPGTTLSQGSLRILLGYDRVIVPYASVGVRLGSELYGQGRRMTTDPAFLRYHAELRAKWWIGHDVFSTSGLRPYLFGSVGIAEEDGKVFVHYSPPGNPQVYNLEAWKRSGHTFVGLGLGLQYAFEKNMGPLAELGFLQFMGPLLPAIAFQLGYAYGF